MTTTQDIKNFRKDLIKQGIISKPPKKDTAIIVNSDFGGLEYNQIPAIRNSELTYLDRSPAHWKAWKDGKTKEPEVFLTGRILHTAILEREKFDKMFVIKQDNRTKEGKLFNQTNEAEGRFLVSPDDLSMIEQISLNLSKDKLIKKMFADALIESEYLFSYKGLTCKAKPDLLKPKKFMLDLKFVVDASPYTFIRKAGIYNYDRQAAFYRLALQAHNLASPKMKFYLLAIEKTPPFAYSLIEISQGVMKQGLEKVNLLLQKYKDTVQKGIYTGYENMVWEEL
jgi:hypothetical protein